CGTGAARRRCASGRARRRARRRLQPHRPRFGGDRPFRAVLHRPARDVLGRCDRLFAAGRAGVGDPERADVDDGVRHRRSAPRRGPRDLRRLSRACPARAQGARSRRRDQRDGARRLPPARRVGARRDVARQPPPRAPRGVDRRARRVLRRLRVAGGRRSRARARAARAARRRGAESRPGRQPCDRRPAATGRAPRSLGSRVVLAGDAAALHGRRARRDGAVPVLHGSHRSGDRRGDARGSQARVRSVLVVLGSGGPGPPGALDVRPVADLAPAVRPVLRRADRASPDAAARAGGRGCGERADDATRTGDAHCRSRAQDGGAPHLMAREVWAGRPFPLGPDWDGEGTNFSLFSENAERVELCLFDAEGNEERIELQERTAFNWHCYLPGVGPGQRYGYRVHGPYDPSRGLRFNSAKLLIDPYAKQIDGAVDWDAANVLPYPPSTDQNADLTVDESDSAPAIPKSVVVDPSFDWQDDEEVRPRTPWQETVIYEVHVKGFTKNRPGVREDLRGTYGGLASEDAIAYLRRLGVTAVELLPVHHIIDEGFLHDRGLTNYWEYSMIGYLAPHSLYAATDDPVREFKGMVKALHGAGIEVILDVVYNHTAEGNHLGPMLSFRGVDNQSYYRLVPDD